MKLKEIFTGVEVQIENERRTWICVENMKHKGVTLDLIDCEAGPCVVINWKEAKLPRFIPIINVRSFVPYPPKADEQKEEARGMSTDILPEAPAQPRSRKSKQTKKEQE